MRVCVAKLGSKERIAALVTLDLRERSDETFWQRGGIVRFLPEKNKIRLRINIDAAKAANLTISSKLLRAADLVGARAGKP